MSKLTDKQIRFCQEYVIDLNATQSAIRAGYSEKTANEQGARMLANVSIQEFISELQQSKSEELNITFDSIAKDVHEIAQDRNERASDRLKAYDQLSKMFGHYEKDNKQKQPMSFGTFLMKSSITD